MIRGRRGGRRQNEETAELNITAFMTLITVTDFDLILANSDFQLKCQILLIRGLRRGAWQIQFENRQPREHRCHQQERNQELPKVLYIVPWQKSDPGDLIGRPVNTLLDEVLAPLDREEFIRQVDYYSDLYGDDE